LACYTSHPPIQGGWGTPSCTPCHPPRGVERGVNGPQGVTSKNVPGFSFWSSPSETTFIGIDRHLCPKKGVGVIYDCTRFCKNLTRAKTWKQAAHTPARTPCHTPTLTPPHPPAHPPGEGGGQGVCGGSFPGEPLAAPHEGGGQGVCGGCCPGEPLAAPHDPLTIDCFSNWPF
jgi:hypothetical protein